MMILYTPSMDIASPGPLVIRNYPNQVFRFQSDYDAVKRALLEEDLRFLREDFAGDASRACFALQDYMKAFMMREYADKRLYDYMTSIGDTGTAVWDHETKTAICPILTEEQKRFKEPLRDDALRWRTEQSETRTELLYLMYGFRRDEDEDDDIYGCGV